MHCYQASLFKLLACLCLLCFLSAGCGKLVTDPDDLKKGFVFKRDSVMYRKVKMFGRTDSVRFTIRDFYIIDTLTAFRKYIIVDSCHSAPPIVMPDASMKQLHVIEPNMYRRYGVADFNGDIVIFPDFTEWKEFPNGFYGFTSRPDITETG